MLEHLSIQELLYHCQASTVGIVRETLSISPDSSSKLTANQWVKISHLKSVSSVASPGHLWCFSGSIPISYGIWSPPSLRIRQVASSWKQTLGESRYVGWKHPYAPTKRWLGYPLSHGKWPIYVMIYLRIKKRWVSIATFNNQRVPEKIEGKPKSCRLIITFPV